MEAKTYHRATAKVSGPGQSSLRVEVCQVKSSFHLSNDVHEVEGDKLVDVQKEAVASTVL